MYLHIFYLLKSKCLLMNRFKMFFFPISKLKEHCASPNDMVSFKKILFKFGEIFESRKL